MSTKAEVLAVLDGIAKINEAERLTFGVYFDYVGDEKWMPGTAPVVPERAAACGGARACLIGSAYIAAGESPQFAEAKGEPVVCGYLIGVDSGCRAAYLANRPVLREACEALDAAALELGPEWSDDFLSEVEATGEATLAVPGLLAETLFEMDYFREKAEWSSMSTEDYDAVTRDAVAALLARARELVEAEAGALVAVAV